MANRPPTVRCLLERALEIVPPAIRRLAGALAEIQVTPAIPPRVEKYPGGRRSDGLDDFFPAPARGIVAFVPGHEARLIPPEDAALHRRWRDARRQIASWLDTIEAISREAPGTVRTRMARLKERLARWTDPEATDAGPATVSSPEANAREVDGLAGELEVLLRDYRAALPSETILRVIDTSALIDCPFPRRYGRGSFDFVIPRTVLKELDELRHHARQAKREGARRALTQVREWERRGNPVEGVTEDGDIRVRFLAQEADMSGAPADLSSEKPDDRILWTARCLTFQFPATAVVLVSGDSNLRTRARLERVETEPAPTC